MDKWHYLPNGTVINIWEDEGAIHLNCYIVPEDKIANNNWHDDMVLYSAILDCHDDMVLYSEVN